ncbi:helix-turn-helix domain-containing protein [Domibacillus iocasae]|uniref:HTH cro/C1-type domain-containing protein n=1 Tax=Domibacillus iocasae TaxID=1714016 RepID=A0A1E7DQS2_9BACI|nr:hypothetical protein BA724_04475 [Domibacillus iocasae]
MLGDKLKALRGKRTQEEVANAIGLSRARYSHYENNRVEPDIDILVKIADYYKVSVDYLVGRPAIPNPELSEEDQKMLAFFNDPETGLFFREMKEAPEDQLEEMRQIWEVLKRRGLK